MCALRENMGDFIQTVLIADDETSAVYRERVVAVQSHHRVGDCVFFCVCVFMLRVAYNVLRGRKGLAFRTVMGSEFKVLVRFSCSKNKGAELFPKKKTQNYNPQYPNRPRVFDTFSRAPHYNIWRVSFVYRRAQQAITINHMQLQHNIITYNY